MTERSVSRRVRGRAAVAVLFVVAGTVTGGWAGRIPTVKAQVGLGDAAWGLVLLAQPLGLLLALLLVTRIATRVRPGALAIPGAAVLLTIAPITAAQHHVATLLACLLVQGVAAGLLFGPMNALAVQVERDSGRSILSSFHAWFSAGQLTGGLAGVAAGAAGLDPWEQLATTNALLAVLLAATARRVPREAGRPVEPAPAAARSRVLTPALLLLALMALLTSVNEGAATQWSAQYSVSLGSSVAVGALTLTCFSLSIAAVRTFGDRIVDRLGPQRFLQASALVSAVGMGLAVGIGTAPAALAGFALLGVGSGCVMPTIMGLSGNLPGVPATRGVAIVSLGEWPSFLLGPPLIGVLAELVGLRFALLVVVAAAAAIALLAARVAPRRRTTEAVPAA